MPASRLAAIQKSTIVRSFTLLEQLAPAAGARWAEALWFRVPSPRGRRDRLVEPGRPFEVQVDGGTVAGEVWGDPPSETVYLLHGWGGWKEQLDAFVEPLTGAGFRVVAFDAPSHGASDPGPEGPGRSTIMDLAGALAAAVAAHGPASAVVAHSLGATAVAYALDHGLEAGRLAFIAPMADPLPYTRVFAARLGFGERTRERLVPRLERRVGMSLSAFDVPAIGRRVATPPLLLVHDRHDAETSWSDSAAIAGSWPEARLVSTTGLGHYRILRDPGVVAEVAGFVTGPAAAASGEQEGAQQHETKGDQLGHGEGEALADAAVGQVGVGLAVPRPSHRAAAGAGADQPVARAVAARAPAVPPGTRKARRRRGWPRPGSGRTPSPR